MGVGDGVVFLGAFGIFQDFDISFETLETMVPLCARMHVFVAGLVKQLVE